MTIGTLFASQSQTRAHRMTFGAERQPGGPIRFRLWAPAHERIGLALEDAPDALRMNRLGDGWHEVITDRAHPGTLYRFELPDGTRVPDPASRFQPNGPHGPSQVIDPETYKWRDGHWRGRPWSESVIYELHTGTFTPEGTFRAISSKLDHLADLGITIVELMPVASFPGTRNWGYDGVLLFSPSDNYGPPHDLKAMIEAAHLRGLSVMLDVVYNHFGPDGNYIGSYAPDFFTSRHHTPWGDAINYDSPGSAVVREFMIENALYWLGEYHFDGLRLDAVHQMHDDSPVHIVTELAERVRGAFPDRTIHLVLENDSNEAFLLDREAVTGEKAGAAPERIGDAAPDEPKPRWYAAQWNDDVHHVLHCAATGETEGYYADYAGRTELLGRALAEGFAFQGQTVTSRGTRRGEPSGHLTPAAFVAFIQNHDQTGNRARGERIGVLTTADAVRALATVYLLLPQIPLLFMGEEWNAAQPFPFFCDFPGELGEAVRSGRREEFARFAEFSDPEMRLSVPDPLATETFQSAKLRWKDLGDSEHANWLQFYHGLLATRRACIEPLISQIRPGSATYDVIANGAVIVRWESAENPVLTLAANLSPAGAPGFSQVHGVILAREGSWSQAGYAGPWSVQWTLD